MNNNYLIGIIAVVVIVIGGFYLANSNPKTNDTPVMVDTVRDTVTNTDEATTTLEDPLVEIDSTIDTSDNAVSFDVTGTNFSFDVKKMTVKKGQTVTINFKNGGGMHDWALDEFEGAQTPMLETGQAASITFVADKTGTFEYYCSMGNHRSRGMVGTFVVTE